MAPWIAALTSIVAVGLAATWALLITVDRALGAAVDDLSHPDG